MPWCSCWTPTGRRAFLGFVPLLDLFFSFNLRTGRCAYLHCPMILPAFAYLNNWKRMPRACVACRLARAGCGGEPSAPARASFCVETPPGPAHAEKESARLAQVAQPDPRVLALLEELARGPMPDWDPPPALLVLNKVPAIPALLVALYVSSKS